MNLRAGLIAAALSGLACTSVICAPLAFAADAKLAAVIAAPQRAPENKARDAARHPEASLEFWGLKPGQTVIEISPGGGYWSEILAPYARQTGGHYIAAIGKAGDKLPAKFADGAAYGDIGYTVFNSKSGPSHCQSTSRSLIMSATRCTPSPATPFRALRPPSTFGA